MTHQFTSYMRVLVLAGSVLVVGSGIADENPFRGGTDSWWIRQEQQYDNFLRLQQEGQMAQQMYQAQLAAENQRWANIKSVGFDAMNSGDWQTVQQIEAMCFTPQERCILASLENQLRAMFPGPVSHNPNVPNPNFCAPDPRMAVMPTVPRLRRCGTCGSIVSPTGRCWPCWNRNRVRSGYR